MTAGSLSEPIIDWLTVVLKPGALEKSGQPNWVEFVRWLLGVGAELGVGSIEKRQWQFYEESASMRDVTQASCGKIGWKTEGDRRGQVCVSLSGNGCRHLVQTRAGRLALRDRLELLGAKVTRIDIAVDDLEGGTIDINSMQAAALAGEFTSNGRPPKSRFISDNGSGDGCSLYVGQKGHKELCIYEKGKQLGDATSAYTRCELRLYGSKLELGLDVVVELEKYFGGAYPLLADFIIGEASRLMVKERQTDCTVEAFLRVTRQQVGTGLGLAYRSLGEAKFIELIRARLLRPGMPGRFQGNTEQDINQLFRDAIERQQRENDNGEGNDS